MMTAMKKRRRAMDITQEELGELVGKTKIKGCTEVSRSWICEIENGNDNCPRWLALAIAKVLRRSTSTLFKRVIEYKAWYVAKEKK